MFYGDQLVYPLVCLVCLGTIALKSFVSRENWARSEMTGMKIAFFVIFDPTWTQILAPKDRNMEFLKQNFNSQSLRKTEAILLPSM